MGDEHETHRGTPCPVTLAGGGGDLLDGESDVPYRRWLQIATLGQQFVEGYEDPYTLDADGAAKVVEVHEHRKAHGHQDILDFNHGSFYGGTPEETGAAGTILQMEARDGGVWALAEFNEYATPLVKDGRFPLLSPEIHSKWMNFDSGEWEDGPAILAVALTARPQLGGMEAIAASRRWQALASKFGLEDAMAIRRVIEELVNEFALRGVFGDVTIHRYEGERAYQYDAHAIQIDPDWTKVVIYNEKTGQYYAADLSDQDGTPALENIVPGTLVFRPDATETEQEAQTMADPKLTEEQVEALAEAMGERTPEDVIALLGAASDLDAEGVQALAARPEPDAHDALKTHVQTLAARLETAEGEATALKGTVADLTAEKADRDATILLDRYPTRVTPAMRPKLLAMAKADAAEAEEFVKLLPETISLGRRHNGDAIPVVETDEDAPKDIHTMVQARQAEQREAGESADYLLAYEHVIATPEGAAAADQHAAMLPTQRPVA